MNKYTEALERAKNMLKQTADNYTCKEFTKNDLHFLLSGFFPELADSEDEKIRKELIEQVHFIIPKETETDDEGLILPAHYERIGRYIAWLEKWKHVDKEFIFKALPRLLEMIEPTDKAKAYCQKLIDSLEKEGYTADAKIVGECLKVMNGEKVAMATMDEQKHTDVQPKFKVGDIIKRKDGKGTPLKIIGIPGNLYYCIKLSHEEDDSPICQILFKNQDIFQLSLDFEHKHAEWSEEDEEALLRLTSFIEDWDKMAKGEKTLKECTLWSNDEHLAERLLNWLKSLRPQKQWKPTDEQMQALWEAYQGGKEQEALGDLFRELKQL